MSSTLLQDLNDDLADQFFAYDPHAVDLTAMERSALGFERVLGIPNALSCRTWRRSAPGSCRL